MMGDELECASRGNPLPNITLFLPDAKTHSGVNYTRINVTDLGDLDGRYTCIAVNVLGRAKAEFTRNAGVSIGQLLEHEQRKYLRDYRFFC